MRSILLVPGHILPKLELKNKQTNKTKKGQPNKQTNWYVSKLRTTTVILSIHVSDWEWVLGSVKKMPAFGFIRKHKVGVGGAVKILWIVPFNTLRCIGAQAGKEKNKN